MRRSTTVVLGGLVALFAGCASSPRRPAGLEQSIATPERPPERVEDGMTARVSSLFAFAGEDLLVTAGEDRALRLHSLEGRHGTWFLALPARTGSWPAPGEACPVLALAAAPATGLVAVADADRHGRLAVVSLEEKRVLAERDLTDRWLNRQSLAFSPSGDTLAVLVKGDSGKGATVELWSPRLESLGQIEVSGYPEAIAVTSSGEVVAGDLEGRITLWSRDGHLVRTVAPEPVRSSGEGSPHHEHAFSRDGALAARTVHVDLPAIHHGEEIEVYETGSDAAPRRLRIEPVGRRSDDWIVRTLCFSQSGDRLAVVTVGNPEGQPTVLEAAVHVLALDGRTLATFDLGPWQDPEDALGVTSPFTYGVAFSPDGHRLVAHGQTANQLQVFSLEDRRP